MHLIKDFGDLAQEMFDRAAAGQMELDAVIVLDDPHRELEQLQDDRGGLGLGQFGMEEDFSAQGMMQDIGSTGEEQAHVVGQEAVIGGAMYETSSSPLYKHARYGIVH